MIETVRKALFMLPLCLTMQLRLYGGTDCPVQNKALAQLTVNSEDCAASPLQLKHYCKRSNQTEKNHQACSLTSRSHQKSVGGCPSDQTDADESAVSVGADETETWITVFVHGIMSVKPHFSCGNCIRFILDRVQNTTYARTVEIMRQDPIFYQNQAMQEVGFKKIATSTVQKNNASSALAAVFESVSQSINPDKRLSDHYYTYGWTGLLSPTQRYFDACVFYKSLLKEIQKFRDQGIDPHIRIIGYSHGGNVCLNLAKVHQCNPELETFTVNELILLGMPVQHETDYLVSDSMFKKIYHIYSRGDRVQKLDCFSLKRFFSRRLFRSRRGFKLPNNLIQIQIKSTRMIHSKSRRIQKRRCNYKNHAYNFKSAPIISGKAHFMRNASPGHTELWFFGWTPVNYRPHFPLSPLPIVAIMPIILQVVNDFQEKSLFNKPTLIDLRPEHEIMVIKNQKSQRILTFARFLTHEEMKKLAQLVIEYAPDHYTSKMYNSRIQVACEQAYNEEIMAKRSRKRACKERRKVLREQASCFDACKNECS